MFIVLRNDMALIVDPHISEEALSFLKKNGIENITVFLTHEHPDHTCGVKQLSENFDIKLICQENCAESISCERNNRPILMIFMLAEFDKRNGTNIASNFQKQFPVYSCHADLKFDKVFNYKWNQEEFIFTSTPGHSRGSCCIYWKNINAVFTGDSLIKDTPVITRFFGGSIRDYNEITVPYLEALDDDVFVFPGHGDFFLMKDIR